MKMTLMGLVLVAATTAAAQTTTTKAPAPAPAGAVTSSQNGSQTTLSPATQTLTTTAPAASNKFGASLIWQSWTTSEEVRDNNSGPLISSDNGIGLTYKISDK